MRLPSTLMTSPVTAEAGFRCEHRGHGAKFIGLDDALLNVLAFGELLCGLGVCAHHALRNPVNLPHVNPPGAERVGSDVAYFAAP
jgi:hypothetical protein